MLWEVNLLCFPGLGTSSRTKDGNSRHKVAELNRGRSGSVTVLLTVLLIILLEKSFGDADGHPSPLSSQESVSVQSITSLTIKVLHL